VNPAALTSYGQSDPFVTDVGVMAYTPADGATFTWGLQDSFGNYPILYRRYACGDGVLDDGEECDEGDLNDDADGAPCRLLCTLPTCGDGYVDLGEECDDGNLSNSDECTVDCLETRCGDGIWQLGEECDDGNLDDGDACTSVCEFGPTYVPCFDVDLGSATGPSVAAGTTTGLSPDYESTCGEFARGPDVTMLWTAPADGTYAFDLSDSAYDTVLHTYDYAGTCGEGLRECDDDSGTTTRSRIETDMRAGEPILLIIDGYNTASGSYVLDIDVVP
jgi:cysteine-rich repeat protein